MRMSEAAGNELADLLWENRPALRRTTAAPHFFPPFACSAAAAGTSSRAEELVKRPESAAAMRDLLLPVQDDDDAVPWLHYPITDGDDDDDCDTAPLPPEYCSGLLSGYADLPAPAPAAVVTRDAGAPSTSHGAAVVPPPEPAVPRQPHRPSGEGVMNFTFFSRPLQRPPASAASIAGVESTVVQTATDRLRSTPLFSEQRMAWLQPPPKLAAAPPHPPPAPLVPVRQREPISALPQQRLQPEPPRAPEPPPVPPPPAATATTSSVCSDNGDRSQLKRSSHHHHHHAAEWSVSQDDEDLDDEAGAPRRSAVRSTKRGRTAEVHNMSERRRRDRINEKMRALQELIPNCNKIDKASMLEEAIEYLKTLQLQVQMMSMAGTGLCVPPMLLPAAAAMQHLQMPPMAHFHHHHLGAMGLAAGFGMPSAFDPRVAAQFPFPMIPGAPPMFAMPSPAPGAHMAVGAAAAQAEQTPSDHPPRAM